MTRLSLRLRHGHDRVASACSLLCCVGLASFVCHARMRLCALISVASSCLKMPTNLCLCFRERAVILFTRSSLIVTTNCAPGARGQSGLVDSVLRAQTRNEKRGPPTSANDLNRVLSFSVYRATSAPGAVRKQILSDVNRGSNQLLMPSAAPREAEAHFCVYTNSTLVVQTTPTAFERRIAAPSFRTSLSRLGPRP